MGGSSEEARRKLTEVGGEVKSAFVEQRSLLSFEEYLAVFLSAPRHQGRSSAQYLRDVLDHYGSVEVETPVGSFRRYRLFDQEFDPTGRAVRVAGQEEVQQAIYRALGNFVRARRVDKLILLHGPNGSAKSSIVQALVRATEAYSRTPEGALYRYHWVFPSERKLKGGGTVGFGSGSAPGELGSYAHLDGEALDARLACPLRDHPLLLVPRAERRAILEAACGPGAEGGAEEFVLSDHLLEGEPCHSCHQIYTALLGAYRGDYLKVLRHVQVERFYVSARYQQAAVTVEPQLSVDAGFHQVTADRSHGALPPALQSLTLLEPFGPLVAANRGILDFADLLKRPLENFKYLLGVSETGRVALGSFLLHLDAVLVGTANETQLAAFQEAAEFSSFRGRLELVRVPYLRRRTQEKEIYDRQVTRAAVGKHVAPHATEAAATWAVLTRLKKPLRDRYEGALAGLVDGLRPLEKLRLYDHGTAPDRLSLSQARELRKHVQDLWRESDIYPNYEGRSGASAREIKTALLNAAQSRRSACLTPAAVLEELEAICRDPTGHDFLQQEPVDGYHAHAAFVGVAEEVVLDAVDEEIRDAMGMVSESQYRDLFGRYVAQVSHWVKGEKIRDRLTGDHRPPDERQMVEFENVVMSPGNDRGDFRRQLISAIGAHRLDHPAESEIDLSAIFPDLLRRLRDHYFEERKRELRQSKENLLRYLSDERPALEERTRARMEAALRVMRDRYGYCDACAQDAILHLLRRRYED